MVKLAGPCLSLEASGKLGGAIVFSRWKGIPYARKLVTPANPKSGKQVTVRAMFKFLSQNWAALTTDQKAEWNDRAAAANISPFNAFMGYNQARWRNFTGPSKFDPATSEGGAATFANHAATGGIRLITVEFDCTVKGDNWGVVIYRSTSSPVTPSITNAIAVILAEDVDSYVYVDTPLAAGTYYYNISGFTDDGLRGGFANDFDGTATDA